MIQVKKTQSIFTSHVSHNLHSFNSRHSTCSPLLCNTADQRRLLADSQSERHSHYLSLHQNHLSPQDTHTS